MRPDSVRGFVKAGTDNYVLQYDRGLASDFEFIEYSSQILIPVVEEATGNRVHTIFFGEDKLNPGRLFSIKVNFVKKQGER